MIQLKKFLDLMEKVFPMLLFLYFTFNYFVFNTVPNNYFVLIFIVLLFYRKNGKKYKRLNF